jgi:hypothetical protein
MEPAALVAGPAGQQARDPFGGQGQRSGPGQLGLQDGVAVLALSGPAAAGSPQQHRVPPQPGHRAHVRRRLTLLLGHEEIGRADQRPGDAAAHDGEHGRQRQVDRENVERAAPVEQPRMAAGGGRLADLPGGQLAVVHHRVRDHPDFVAGRVHPPAEVDVVTEQGQVGVEAAQLVPDVPADQHARRADRQHPAVPVLLALVDLARLDPGEAPARPVGGDAGLAQHPAVVEVPELRAQHRDGPAAAGRPEQLLERVGGRLAVVVQQPDPLHRRFLVGRGFRDRPARRRMLQRAGDGLAVAGLRLHAEHRVRSEQLRQRRSAAVPAAGVHADRAVHGMCLLMHRLHQARQKPGTVVCYHHSGDDVTEMRCVL